MFKYRIKNFFLKNGFTETHKGCFEKDGVAFVLEGRKLLACKKDENGYKILRETPLRIIKGIYRTGNGTAVV